ncbi:Aste57867_17297 [Aphanomyces stellatus]|uniref:Aste57867_17297 protein n=1 Tax=Aphanomyces stellatus TaxID=120398 RepID=A0A485L8D0_9STRA|nr:hypothetical protein As57867_017238 [Aphanomyces stellatus]KAF0713643.1 hypothetical protein As57867_004254 [Aphanomyces stellatus]VFT81380.1 Aste57867_4265 [Aphanomyces stellatus]VFT94053.1 Aste57867_17297 [Aphanomyces stellatus]
MTSLGAAARTGNLEEVQKLIASGCNPNSVDEDERTALHWAASSGHMDVVEFLTDMTQIDHKDDSGWTALMSAVSAGHVDVASYLLSKGANANLANENGQIALHYHKGRQEMTELLLDSTSDINKADRCGATPLTKALGGRPAPEIIVMLLDHGAKLNMKDINGNTPLHIALLEGHEGIAALLVEHGADPRAVNKDKQSCLDIAPRSFQQRVTAKPY